MVYSFFRPLIFSLDSETAHNMAMHLAVLATKLGAARVFKLINKNIENPILETECLGLNFPNPLGLAAGFDKEAKAISLLGSLGFGSIEIGTVTPQPQPGNPRPRIFRLQKDSALINRMGFPSEGMDRVFDRLAKQNSNKLPLLGVNIGKNKDTSADNAVDDYIKVATRFAQVADWITINVSSPNTPGLRDLQSVDTLKRLIEGVRGAVGLVMPLLVKLSPDLAREDLDSILQMLLQQEVQGVIVSNTTISRDGLKSNINQAGGLSGRPLFQRTVEDVSHVYKVTDNKLPIIGVGGVSSMLDMLQLICSGASLVQGYTALVYQGPMWPAKINFELAKVLKSQGVKSLKTIRGDIDFFNKIKAMCS